MNGLILLPYPRTLTFSGDACTIVPGRRIVLQGDRPADLLFIGQRLQAALRQTAGVEWELAAAVAGPAAETGAILRLAPDASPTPSQGYELIIGSDRIVAEARTPAGLFYAVCTLAQILTQCGTKLPGLQIADWPDYPARGVMLDISRDKVPTMDTLYRLADLLAGWKINQLQLYTEHTFAYRNHPTVWVKASPMTGQEILELDAYCRQRFIELVPNQNSFGHMRRWLIHDRYRPLAEAPDGCDTVWGHFDEPFTLCPGDPGSLALIRSLYDELLPHFSSRLFNVGCDETVDLGQGRSAEECARRGVGRVYLDFLLQIYREVTARGRTMQFWGDIVIHHPELLAALPRDLIALEWGYEADHPFHEDGAQFAAAGVPFYVCPGTSSWNTIAGRSDNALGNLFNAAENGRKHGAIGYLNTDWGDNGHWQYLPVSYLGFAAGAAFSWALDANRQREVAPALSWHAFHDAAGVMGQLACDLGNTYRALDFPVHNSNGFFHLLRWPLARLREQGGLSPEALQRALAAIDAAMRLLPQARMARPDAQLIKDEFESAAALMRHACHRALLLFDDSEQRRRELNAELDQLIQTYRRLWLARNRPGGLEDSIQHFDLVRAAYHNE